MERWNNCVAVVTGASSGIGEAIAKDLVTAGLRVVAIGRRQERLNENKAKLAKDLQSRFYAIKCDVSIEDDVKATFEWIVKTLGGVDILVNNAAIVKIGKNLVDMPSSAMDEVINTNVKGVVYCTQAAYKSMKERNFAGHIVHINSIAGHQVINVFNHSSNIYSPTKFALTAINEVIRHELRNLGTKIKTTNVSPGAVRTEIATQEQFDIYPCILNSEDISQAVLFAISTPPHVQIHEITVKPVGEMM